jgi:SAM-dependent methyltransferase
MRLIEQLHEVRVLSRRARVLSGHLATLVPADANVLDVGCGDGLIAALLQERRPDVRVSGVDVLVREDAAIAVQGFDGRRLPYAESSFDVVMFVDVLHHTQDPLELLCEAARVTRRWIVLKDHLREGWLAGPTLRFMDRVGNRRHGVTLPYNYWPRQRWEAAFASIRATVESWSQRLDLYPWPASVLFGRSLHFVTRLSILRQGSQPAIPVAAAP